MSDIKLYVMVRRDLPWAVRCVQAVHAASKLAYEKNYWTTNPGDLHAVLIGIKDEPELRMWHERLEGVCMPFYEPDLNDQMTALAFLSLPDKELEGLPLL